MPVALSTTELRRWAAAIKVDVVALWLSARDPRVPWVAKLVAGIIAAYALSPVDLVPDFIPILGYLDDLIIVPLGILLAVRLILADVMRELRTEATQRAKPISRLGLVIVISVWLLAVGVVLWMVWPHPAGPSRPA
jgi:uncharacterized membrane protein YkvA (DUF1232 family)